MVPDIGLGHAGRRRWWERMVGHGMAFLGSFEFEVGDFGVGIETDNATDRHDAADRERR